MKKMPRSPPIVTGWYPRRITDSEPLSSSSPPPPFFSFFFVELMFNREHTAGLIENIRCRRSLRVHTPPFINIDVSCVADINRVIELRFG